LDGQAVLVTRGNEYISKTGDDSGYWSDIKGLVEDLTSSDDDIPTSSDSEYRSAGYQLPPRMWRGDASWWYLMAITVEESEV
jgi:hypothetical protein